MAADLHTHTTASDGTLAPEELVRRAAELGLDAVGITDHDTMAGLPEAEEAGRRSGIAVVPGVELSTDATGREVHILGYYCRADAEPLASLLAAMRAGREERVERILAALARAGVSLTREDVLAAAAGEAQRPESLGRPHVARALVQHGYAESVADAFARFLVPGKPGYVPRPKLHPADAVRCVRAAGGAAVLAHPGLVGDDSILTELLAAGLQGLEVWYPDHTPEQLQRYLRLCEDLGLIPTGGSDFHGRGERWAELGQVTAPSEVVERLAAAAQA